MPAVTAPTMAFRTACSVHSHLPVRSSARSWKARSLGANRVTCVLAVVRTADDERGCRAKHPPRPVRMSKSYQLRWSQRNRSRPSCSRSRRPVDRVVHGQSSSRTWRRRRGRRRGRRRRRARPRRRRPRRGCGASWWVSFDGKREVEHGRGAAGVPSMRYSAGRAQMDAQGLKRKARAAPDPACRPDTPPSPAPTPSCQRMRRPWPPLSLTTRAGGARWSTPCATRWGPRACSPTRTRPRATAPTGPVAGPATPSSYAPVTPRRWPPRSAPAPSTAR